MMKGASVKTTVFVDADNTLWDTDAVFAQAQVQLLAEVESAVGISATARDRLAFIRAIDQRLAEQHHQGLRYPPRLLARAAALALAHFSPSRAARSAWLGDLERPLEDNLEASIEQTFLAAIARSPELRPGVIEGLDRLRKDGSEVLIVTESAEAKASATADRLGLRGHFTRVIEGKKRPDLYKRLIRLRRSEGQSFMVGDQLDRDIAPAKTAGLTTIYFPSGFKPKWMPDEVVVQPDFKIESFAEVPAIIARCLASGRNRQQAV